MRVAEISSFSKYSVGKIMRDIKSYIDKKSEDVCEIFYAREELEDDEPGINYIGSKPFLFLNAFAARVLDNDGFCSKRITKKLISELEIFKPDVIHIHCLHGYYMNSILLFEYLKKNPNIRVIWTQHDCWSFTGHCCFFDSCNCNKWLSQCDSCLLKKQYPKSILLDNSKKNFLKKKNIFLDLESKQLTLVCPSEWLYKLINKSYMNNYLCKIIYNGIDLDIFNNDGFESKPFNFDYILGVASVWDDRKGLKYFLELSKIIDENMKIVLIGKFPKRIELPKNIIHIERTNNQSELKNYYHFAICLLNPTIGDNYPTVNIEAQACGGKVLSFNTGGCAETNCGNLYIQQSCDINEIKINIINLMKKPLNEIDFNKISKLRMAEEYYSLFTKVLER